LKRAKKGQQGLLAFPQSQTIAVCYLNNAWQKVAIAGRWPDPR
jgi:hypothetical protein